MKISTLIGLVSILMFHSACNNQAIEQEEDTVIKTDTTTQANHVQPETDTVLKKLEFNNITFHTHTEGTGSIKNLIIQTNGLENDQEVELKLEGELTDSVVTDLNSDGFPELVLFTQSAGSGSYGNVIAFSVNKGKSMSQVYFPPVNENVKMKEGYMGHDRFFVQNSRLVHEFPIYKNTDPNTDPTGGTRRIEYKLADGEASRKFVVDKISELPEKN